MIAGDLATLASLTDAQCDAMLEVIKGFIRATHQHSPFHTPHEGYAVILEELDELKAGVWKPHHDRARMRAEAAQVAAMGLRFMLDLCGEKDTYAPSQKT